MTWSTSMIIHITHYLRPGEETVHLTNDVQAGSGLVNGITAPVTDTVSRTTHFDYDSMGNDVNRTTTVLDGLNHPTVITLNEQGRPASVQDALQHATTFSYRLGEMSSISDALGRTTSWFTDTGGRVLQTTECKSGH